MVRDTHPGVFRYGVAILTVILALLLKLGLELLIETDTPFLVFFSAVMVSAWFGGIGPGLLATVLATLCSDYFFISPQKLFIGQGWGSNSPLGLFMLEGVLISTLSAALHAARRRAEASKLKSHQHQEDLHRSEERYRLLIESVRDYAIFLLDPDGHIMSWNVGAERIHGYWSAEVMGRHFSLFYPQQDQDAGLPTHELKTAAQAGRFEKSGLQVRKNGTHFWADILITPLRGGAGELQGFSQVTRDITERKQVAEALQARADELARTTQKLARTAANLEKRNQELDQFTYVLSHDLKAPLRAIANLSQWIEEDLTEQEATAISAETQHHMNLLRGRVQRMEVLIEGALQYSRVGRVETPVTQVNVAVLLQRVIDSLAPPPEFVIDIEPGMPTFFTERSRLEQVFANLIGNAIKHHNRTLPGNAAEGTVDSETGQSPGLVQISVQDQGQFYEFTVADNGPGIAPRYHDKVFGIFQTLEARDKVENSGIGLALVKKIVENKGGTIRLESQTGQGVTFRFTWPKQPPGNADVWQTES